MASLMHNIVTNNGINFQPLFAQSTSTEGDIGDARCSFCGNCVFECSCEPAACACSCCYCSYDCHYSCGCGCGETCSFCGNSLDDCTCDESDACVCSCCYSSYDCGTVCPWRCECYDDDDYYISGITWNGNDEGIETTQQALAHYFDGTGTPVSLGNNSVESLINSSEFQYRHGRIISGQTTSLNGSFPVNLASSIFHIGDTNVNYSITCYSGYCTVTYTLFSNDGFYDVDTVDEIFLWNIFGIPQFEPDGLGSNLERFGGTPYTYNTTTATYTFPNPGY